LTELTYAELLHELQVHEVELSIQNEELRESRDRYAELYDYGPSAYLTVDAKTGKITEMNITATDLLGVNRSQAYGRRFTAFIEPEFADNYHLCTRKVMEAPFRESCELRMHSGDGSVFWALLDIRGEPESARIRIAVTDISEQKHVEQIKDDFIGMVSHELRTPLTVVLGAIAVARSEGISREDLREMLDEAARSAETLSHILENLIELSRFQSDRMQLKKEQVSLEKLLDEVVPCASFKEHPVWLEIPPGLPGIAADRIRLKQVISNLLDNAAKYSPPKTEIRITVRQDKEKILIGVSDRGKGISSEDQAKLFEPFERLREKSTTTPGLGLGLLVCRRMVEAHGGSIWVESVPDKGSNFWFTLPLDPAPPPLLY